MDSNWNQQSLNVLFGSNVDEISNRLGNLVYNAFNHWIWCSSSNISNISASIYKFVNYNKGSANNWGGWKRIWSLKVAPRVKHFIWLAFNKRVNTYEYL